MISLRILGLWLHLLAIVVWVGTTIGWAIVLVTEASSGKDVEVKPWVERLGRRVYTIGWEAVVVVVLTGLFNLLPRVDSGRLFETGYVSSFLVKLSLVVGMVGIQFWQHMWLVPALSWTGDDESPEKTRRRLLFGSAIFALLAAGALWFGLRLRFS